MRTHTAQPNLHTLLADFRLLVILHISFRVIFLLAYEPLLINDSERGLGAGGDRLYHYDLAALSAQDLYPFRDWWSEFPPVWFLTTTGVYQLLGQNVNFGSWSMTLGLLVLVFDVGILLLMRKLGSHLHGESTGMALAWVYALLAAPMIFIWWNFETIVAYFFLLSLWWALQKRDDRSALAAAVGALTKFTPALMLGVVWRFYDWRKALRYSVLVLAGFMAVYGLLLINNPNPQMALVSLTAQFGKSSYQTVWALLDGNTMTGNFGTVESHFDPAQANALTGNPAVIPGWLRLGLAGIVGLWVFRQTRRFDDKGFVAFTGIALLIFFLQAQGWSPQWLVQIIPLILLVFPNRSGILVVVMLSLISFVEYPLLFIRTGDTGGRISGALMMPFTLLIIARTAILVGVCVGFYQRLRQEPVK